MKYVLRTVRQLGPTCGSATGSMLWVLLRHGNPIDVARTGVLPETARHIRLRVLILIYLP